MKWDIVLATFISSGIASAIVSYLFKLKLEHELDRQRAFLQRQTRVHELQIQALTVVYSLLHTAHVNLKYMAGPIDDATAKQATKQFWDALNAAEHEVVRNRLLVPPSLAERMDELMKKLTDGSVDASLMFSTLIPANDRRLEMFERHRAIAYNEIPAMLKLIEADARGLIHGT